ncbi:PAS domain-containing sensor histidine kinase [Aliidiomarina sp. B3213]|uniref:sensor histidine kinase n=1 Tax=Aliidiomarina sp. B3213 TaxID=2249757 RepID=UPI001FB3E62A|nr:ATP-binding protein [Aliidiomarina sp. B3213]
MTSLRFKLSTKYRLYLLCALLTFVAIGIQYIYFDFKGVEVPAVFIIATCSAGVFLGGLLRWAIRPLLKEIQALNLHAQNLQDGSFNTSANQLKIRELDNLAESLQSMSKQLRQERAALNQRELLLDTILQSSPLALVLTDSRDTIIMSNPSARQLFTGGRAIDGSKLADVSSTITPLENAICKKQQGLLRLPDQSVWHLSINQFKLNHNQHWLYLLKPLTREIQREELTAWKKLLRVIGHELNNSLAPLSSLGFSGRERAKQLDQFELANVFETISERASEINEFVQAYIQFAKLPPPKMSTMNWPRLINQLQNLYEFELLGDLPQREWQADPNQLHQLLLNLLKNGHESGSAKEEITLQILENHHYLEIVLQDRGGGMSSQQLQHALIPFYTTKTKGSGIGLTLCRDIIEGHGGTINIRNKSGGLEVRLILPMQSGNQQ